LPSTTGSHAPRWQLPRSRQTRRTPFSCWSS